MKSGSLDCLKYVVFAFNLLFFIFGIAALGIGIWAVVNQQAFKQILVDNSIIFSGVYVIIAIGAALTLIGFLGCCGAIKENRCLLGTFFVILLIIFLAQVAGMIYLYVKQGSLPEILDKTMSKYGDNTTSGTAIQQGWDTVQNTIQCCGAKNYSDWKSNSDWASRFPEQLVPNSCCKRDMKNGSTPILDLAACQAADAKYLNEQGCATKLQSSMTIAAIIAGVILVIELLGMIFACCLYQHVNDYGEIA